MRNQRKSKATTKEPLQFNPKRFPTTFQIKGGDGSKEGLKFFKVPEKGNRDINFATDVENEYFDRTDEPGDLEIRVARLDSKITNYTTTSMGTSESDSKLDIVRSSPNQGKIRINIGPTSEAQVGDRFKISTKLSAPGGEFEQQFLAEICEPDKNPSKPKPQTEQIAGLPELVTCTENGRDGTSSWNDIESSGIPIEHSTVLRLVTDEGGSKLSKIVINMDSRVFLDYRKNQKSQEAMQLVEKRYISSIYLHSIFLFASAKNGSYNLTQSGKNNESTVVELEEFISDIFSITYAQFLLNFEVSDILDVIS